MFLTGIYTFFNFDFHKLLNSYFWKKIYIPVFEVKYGVHVRLYGGG